MVYVSYSNIYFSDKLDLPVIQNVSTRLSAGKISANISCTAVQKSAAPLFYHPTFEVLWKYPMDASYTVLHNGSNLILDEVDCSSHKSQPLFCSVRETSGPYSESQHFYPHILCKFTGKKGTLLRKSTFLSTHSV